MKNFTRYALSCAMMLGFYVSSSAQNDIETYQIDLPDPNNKCGGGLSSEINTPIDFRFRNNGPGTIPQGTQVEIHITQNGTPLPPITGFTIPTGGLAPMGDLGFPGPPSIKLNGCAGATSNICFEAVVVGNTDPTPGNNQLCQVYDCESGTDIDLEMSNLGIVVPSVNPGDTVGKGGTVVLEMTVTISNKGTVSFPAGYVIPYSLEVAGQTPNSVTGTLTDCMEAGTGVSVRAITNTAVIPALPAPGDFEYCATVMISNDVDPNNNKTCTPYVSAFPTGIEEVENDEALSSVYYNNANESLELFLSNTLKGDVKIIITNTAGQMVKNFTLNVNGQTQEKIDLSGAQSGFYMMTLQSAEGDVETHKFIVN